MNISDSGVSKKTESLHELASHALESAIKTRDLLEETIGNLKPASEEQKLPVSPNPLNQIEESLRGIIDACEYTRKYFIENYHSRL